MRNSGLAYIGLVFAGLIVLIQPGSAQDFAGRGLRNLLAVTRTPEPENIQPYGNSVFAPEENSDLHPISSFIRDALDAGGHGSFFMSGSRANGGMAISVTHATFPGHGYVLGFRWQLGQ